VRDLNLARRPFVNVRPVRRAAVLLLVVGVGLTVANAVVYWKHFTGEGRTRSRSQELARELAAEQESIAELRSEIVAMNIGELNERAGFVNAEIDRRRFGWSRLFDRIAEVQPDSVRLLSLYPRFADERRGRAADRDPNDRVMLEIRGVAKGGDAILALIDGLFAHPAFSSPDLSREARREDGTVEFALGVAYRRHVESSEEPEGPGAGVEAVDGEAEQTGSGNAAAGEEA
jgi:Tfp pilus assembly protein PilN